MCYETAHHAPKGMAEDAESTLGVASCHQDEAVFVRLRLVLAVGVPNAAQLGRLWRLLYHKVVHFQYVMDTIFATLGTPLCDKSISMYLSRWGVAYVSKIQSSTYCKESGPTAHMPGGSAARLLGKSSDSWPSALLLISSHRARASAWRQTRGKLCGLSTVCTHTLPLHSLHACVSCQQQLSMCKTVLTKVHGVRDCACANKQCANDGIL
jgi:hypothetical protein